MKEIAMNNSILIYQTNDGSLKTEVTLQNESVWLTQNQLSELFGTKRPAITKHLGQIFKSQELREDSVCSILERTAADGKRYKTKLYASRMKFRNLPSKISCNFN